MPIIATAAWAVPKAVAERFPEEGSALERYAAVFTGVEINSTFYKSHRSSTYERWAGSVGDDFRFAVKIPKDITHGQRLSGIGEAFRTFLSEIEPLGGKTGPLLCQLPPSLAFDPKVMSAAFDDMRAAYQGPLMIEPRHRSWATDAARALLDRFAVARVLADPAPVWPRQDFGQTPAYMRLHGAPRIYYSSYSPEDMRGFASMLGPDSWCVFDNTALGAATENALDMLDLI